MKQPDIGDVCEVLDSCGMLTHKMKFIGKGFKYRTHDGETYYKEEGDGYEYYVFQSLEENDGYKYAACTPYFRGLNFSCFYVERYGNDLHHLFVDFRQTFFDIGGEYSVQLTHFPDSYKKELENSGNNGYMI
jgi:hypothetical protein